MLLARQFIPIAIVAAALLPGCAELESASTESRTGSAGSADGPGDHSARVTHIADGDTITLSGLGKTRLIGVDTPEVYGGAECYGKEASKFTKRLLPIGTRVTYTVGTEPRDRYNRALAYVWLEDNMVNLTLAEKGYAVQLTIPPNVEYEQKIRAAVRDAREHDRGLWAADTCAGDADDRVAEPDADAPSPQPSETKRCKDFTTQADAQRYFDSHPSAPMDGDRDGRACETLP